MYKSSEFQIEIWPGIVRIHQGYETEEQDTIELTADQVPEFCKVLQDHAKEAAALGAEMEAFEQKIRIGKSLSAKAGE